VQDQVSIVPNRLQWTLGTKLECNNITNLEVEPSTRLLWTPDDRNSIWGAVSRSVRVPSIYENSYVVGGTFGTDDPRAETTYSYEIGYKVQPIKPLTLDVTGFYNAYTGLIETVPNVLVPGELDYANAVDASSYGAEVSANWQVTDRCRLAASYTCLAGHAQAESNSPGDVFMPAYLAQLVVGSSPQNQFQVHCYLDLLKNLQLNTSLYYVDALSYINAISTGGSFQSVPSYFRLDANLRWQVRQNMALTVGVQNLLQSRHYESGEIDSNTALPTEVPRTFFAEWSMAF
jgi:iron complex outermembrane receptor protein